MRLNSQSNLKFPKFGMILSILLELPSSLACLYFCVTAIIFHYLFSKWSQGVLYCRAVVFPATSFMSMLDASVIVFDVLVRVKMLLGQARICNKSFVLLWICLYDVKLVCCWYKYLMCGFALCLFLIIYFHSSKKGQLGTISYGHATLEILID